MNCSNCKQEITGEYLTDLNGNVYCMNCQQVFLANLALGIAPNEMSRVNKDYVVNVDEPKLVYVMKNTTKPIVSSRVEYSLVEEYDRGRQRHVIATSTDYADIKDQYDILILNSNNETSEQKIEKDTIESLFIIFTLYVTLTDNNEIVQCSTVLQSAKLTGETLDTKVTLYNNETGNQETFIIKDIIALIIEKLPKYMKSSYALSNWRQGMKYISDKYSLN